MNVLNANLQIVWKFVLLIVFMKVKNMLVINPDECIDCGVCEPECPIDAIVSDVSYNEKDKDKWLEVNKKYSGLWPNIVKKKDPPIDAEKFKKIKISTTNIFLRIQGNKCIYEEKK